MKERNGRKGRKERKEGRKERKEERKEGTEGKEGGREHSFDQPNSGAWMANSAEYIC